MSKSVPDPNRGILPKPQPRKLIVCIDGTSNKFSAQNTNVVELYNRIRKDETQLTYYNSGIGTYARPFWWSFAYLKQQIMNTVDLAIAWNFEKVVLGAYRWLSDNYRPGDRIFLFGFSRGAYQVRTLAGMIQHVGLIYPGNQEQIPFAWEVYSNDDPQAEKFKETFSRKSVDLHFVGVWDTVASVGALPRKPFPLSNSCEHITHLRHALALDERRVKFLPEHIEDSGQGEQTLEQVWFVGTHSDIGGGNKVNTTLDRGGEPLKWMMEQAYARGLSVRMHDVKLGLPHAEVTDSMRKLKWLVLEVLPFLGWRNYLPNGEPRSSWRPHLMRAREVLPYHSIHWTVKASLEQAKSRNEENLYSPKAIALDEAKNADPEEAKELKTKVIERSWEYMRTAEPMLGRPDWTNDDESMRMMDILLDKNPSNKDEWFKNLCSYALPDKNSGDLEEPKAAGIWPYGGPRFIQDLFQDYLDKPEIKEIARSIIGFDSALNWNKPPPPPKPTDETDQLSLEQDIKKDLAVRLRDMVIPRVGLLLRQWAEKTPEARQAQLNPGWKGRLLALFKSQKANTSDDNPVDVNWDWNRIEKENRSMAMACVAVNVIVDITKSKYSQVLQEASGKIAGLVLGAMFELTGPPTEVVETASDWKKDKAELAEAILSSMIALFSYEGTKDAFHMDSAGSILHPLVAAGDSHPTLALQAMRTAALLVEDFYCGIDLATPELIFKLSETMSGVSQGNEPVKQQLADEASLTMVKLSAHTWCSSQISDQNVLDQLSKLLEDGKYVKDVLRVFKNVSTDYPENIGTEKIGGLVKLMSNNTDASLTLANVASQSADYFKTELFEAYSQAGVANEIVALLNHEDDAYIQAAALLLTNLINREGEFRKKNGSMERNLVVPEISQALATSLGAPSRSQATTDVLLTATVKFALQASISDDLLAAVAPLASGGDKQAILAVIASAAYDESEREGIDRYLPTLFEMLVPSDEVHLKESMEALTILVKNGYNLPDPYPRVAVEKVAGVLQSANDGTFYTSDELYWIRDNVLTVALDLVEALCNNLLTADHVIQLSLLREVVLGLASNFNSGTFFDYANLMLSRLSNDDRYRELVQDLRKELNQPEPEPKPDAGDETVDEQNEPEQESDDKDAEEYGIDETTPLISGD